MTHVDDRSDASQGATAVLVAARAREAAGERIVRLEVGEPDAPTPAHVVEAAVRALRAGATRYVEPAGLPGLREAIAAHVCARGVQAGPAQVVVTSGAKPLLLYTALAVLRPGDEVLVPDPGYPVVRSIVQLAGARAVPYPLHPVGRWVVDVAAVEAAVTPRTRVLVLNSPHNPTGAVLAPDALDALAALAHRHDLLVLSDEIYARHVYDGTHESIASRPGMADRTVLVDGFSKAYAMTGWRLGYGVMPEALAERVTQLVVQSTSCAPPFVQHAGLAALTGPDDEMHAYVAELRGRRSWIADALNEIAGIRCRVPQGAFYVFPDVSGLLARGGLSSGEFAARLLREHGVACVPGSAFGARGEGHLRLSFAVPPGDLRLAVTRIESFARGLDRARG